MTRVAVVGCLSSCCPSSLHRDGARRRRACGLRPRGRRRVPLPRPFLGLIARTPDDRCLLCKGGVGGRGTLVALPEDRACQDGPGRTQRARAARGQCWAPPAHISMGRKPFPRPRGRGEGGERERGNDTSGSTGRSGRQNAATRRNMRREDRVTVLGPAKEQQPDGMSHGGGGGRAGAFWVSIYFRVRRLWHCHRRAFCSDSWCVAG